jgi:5-methylcytosine-specific restriction protein B
MARKFLERDSSKTLAAAEHWIKVCLIADQSLFSEDALWSPALLPEIVEAFIGHPDNGDNDFITKLKGHMKSASPSAQKLMAEMLWALLLFPSNVGARTKRQQVRDIWMLTGQTLSLDVDQHEKLMNGVTADLMKSW